MYTVQALSFSESFLGLVVYYGTWSLWDTLTVYPSRWSQQREGGWSVIGVLLLHFQQNYAGPFMRLLR